MEYREPEDRERLEELLLGEARPLSRLELAQQMGADVQVVS